MLSGCVPGTGSDRPIGEGLLYSIADGQHHIFRLGECCGCVHGADILEKTCDRFSSERHGSNVLDY